MNPRFPGLTDESCLTWLEEVLAKQKFFFPLPELSEGAKEALLEVAGSCSITTLVYGAETTAEAFDNKILGQFFDKTLIQYCPFRVSVEEVTQDDLPLGIDAVCQLLTTEAVMNVPLTDGHLIDVAQDVLARITDWIWKGDAELKKLATNILIGCQYGLPICLNDCRKQRELVLLRWE